MLHKDIPKVSLVVVYVWKGRAYIPIQAQYESGIFVGIEPVIIASLNIEEMAEAVRAVKDAGHKRLPDPKTREEFLARKDPVLEATHARSWKQLAKTGASYTIGWTENEVRIDMSRLDKKGRWEYDLEKARILPSDTPIDQIVEIILEDLKARPEALKMNNY